MINRNFWNFFPHSLSSQIALFQFCLALSLLHIFSFFFSLSIHILLLSPLDISRIFWAYYHYHHSSLICSGSIKILIHRICMKKERKNNKILATYTHTHTYITQKHTGTITSGMYHAPIIIIIIIHIYIVIVFEPGSV